MTNPACASCGHELPPNARFCPGCGAAQGAAVPKPVETLAPKGAARKITSVLFGDLVGFTSLSESRDAEEVRELLTAYFDECRAVVSRYGGELEKFIGDAVMAVWGIPVTREDDAERAVRAGLELVERVTALGDRIGMPGLSMRVGITTAEVAVTLGATGQGMVAGDPVNTAARIQSAAEPGQVWVDETTRSFTTSVIAYDDAGSHAMKGKAEPVPLWAVRAVIAGARGDRQGGGLEAQLVGRDRELRLVKEVFHRVEETLHPGMLIIDGEAGVGKSRLGWEFEKYVDGFDASVLWHRGRCLSYGEGVAYFALAEAVRARLAILAGTDESTGLDSRQVLDRGLAACVPDAEERAWLGPRLAALLGLESGTLFPREDLFVAWTAFFKYVGLWQTPASNPQPVVLVIDDAQYADGGLLAFLEHLLSAADYPVFVVVLARPELLADHPALAGNRRITVIHLEPLSSAEMAVLLGALVLGVPTAIQTELVARAEGIPLYALETVRSLVDQEIVVLRDGHYVLGDPDAVDLGALTAPASLQALIAARLDTLPAGERRVVDRASVLGQVFSDTGIAALCAEVADLDEALAGLVRREVIRRDSDRLSADFGNYRFVQGAVRQVAYGMLSRRDRKATHLTVAAALEAELESRDDADELSPIIAQHYLDAIDAVPADPDVPELARASADHLVRAADRAAGLGAPAEAAAHLEKALSRCEPDRRLLIQSRLARQLRHAGQYERAIEHASATLKGYDAIGDDIAAAVPAEDLALALVYGEGDLGRAESVVREYLGRLPDAPGTLTARADLTTALAAVLLRGGKKEAFRRTAEESLRLAERIGDPVQMADSWITYALGCLDSGLPHLGMTLLERAAEVADEHRAYRIRALALLNLAAFATFDDLAMGVRHGRSAVAAARELGEKYVLAFAQFNLAAALVQAGDWEEAKSLARIDDVLLYLPAECDVALRLMALARGEEWPAVLDALDHDPESAGDLDAKPLQGLDRSLEAYAAGHPEASATALDCVRRSADLAEGVDEHWIIWLIGSVIACGQRDLPVMAEMVALVDDQKGPWPSGIRAQRAHLRAVVGEDGSLAPEAVEASYTEALATVREWGSALFEAHICADFGAWLVRQDRHAEGAVLLDSARVFHERVGASRWLAEVDQPSKGIS